MTLLALAISAAISAETPAERAAPAARETPNLYQPRLDCGALHRQVIERQREELRKLGRLPNANRHYAVNRQIGGCGVPAPMGYHPGYLLPGAADAPTMRGDAPSNRPTEAPPH
jgi:hypothetical protein